MLQKHFRITSYFCVLFTAALHGDGLGNNKPFSDERMETSEKKKYNFNIFRLPVVNIRNVFTVIVVK